MHAVIGGGGRRRLVRGVFFFLGKRRCDKGDEDEDEDDFEDSFLATMQHNEIVEVARGRQFIRGLFVCSYEAVLLGIEALLQKSGNFVTLLAH